MTTATCKSSSEKVKAGKRRKFSAVGLFIVTLIAYIFFAPFNWPFYELILFPFPDPRTPDISQPVNELTACGAKFREVTFPSANGRMLHALFFELPNTKRVFLFSHGKGNNIYGQVRKARQYLACGGSFLMYDYQGFGRSAGHMSISGAVQDGVSAYDYLTNVEHRSSKDIIAVGESFGSGVTCQLAQKRPISAIILHSGFSSLSQAGKDVLCWLYLYPKCWWTQEDLDNLSVLQKSHPPLLIIHGKRDQCISRSHADQLYAAAKEPKELLILPGGHSTYGRGNEFGGCVKSFIQRYNL